MDNKPVEELAEGYIRTQLLKFKFNVLKPSFDRKGADLIIIDGIENKYSRFILIQSKDRSTSDKSTSVKIPKAYVEDNFVLFIYTIDENKNDFAFMFLAEEIRNWNLNKDEYTLSFNNKIIQTHYFTEKIFNTELANRLHLLLTKTEIKKYTSVIIDGVFLRKAIDITIKTYKEIWPEKEFIKPDLNTVIESILDCYDKFKAEKKIIDCYLFLSESFDLESKITINKTNNIFRTTNGNQVRIFINKSDEIICFEVLEQLNRLINNYNIILVADDPIYEEPLSELKNKGVEIIVVMFNKHDGSEMFIEFKWGDILYPLGIAIGLEEYEI